MCFQNCPYESYDGSCGGRKFATPDRKPFCMDEEEYEAFLDDKDRDDYEDF